MLFKIELGKPWCFKKERNEFYLLVPSTFLKPAGCRSFHNTPQQAHSDNLSQLSFQICFWAPDSWPFQAEPPRTPRRGPALPPTLAPAHRMVLHLHYHQSTMQACPQGISVRSWDFWVEIYPPCSNYHSMTSWSISTLYAVTI